MQSTRHLWGDFKRWAEQGGHNAGTETRFGRELTTRGYGRTRRRDGYYRHGIRLHDDRPVEREPYR